MELLTTITSLLSAGDMFMSLRDRYRSRTNKDTLALWLIELADLIESVAEDLNQGRYPHSKCAQMQFYLAAFYDMIKNELSTEYKQKLFDLVDESYKVERLLGQLNNLTEQEKQINLNKMREAAGIFRGMSDYLKLKR